MPLFGLFGLDDITTSTAAKEWVNYCSRHYEYRSVVGGTGICYEQSEDLSKFWKQHHMTVMTSFSAPHLPHRRRQTSTSSSFHRHHLLMPTTKGPKKAKVSAKPSEGSAPTSSRTRKETSRKTQSKENDAAAAQKSKAKKDNTEKAKRTKAQRAANNADAAALQDNVSRANEPRALSHSDEIAQLNGMCRFAYILNHDTY